MKQAVSRCSLPPALPPWTLVDQPGAVRTSLPASRAALFSEASSGGEGHKSAHNKPSSYLVRARQPRRRWRRPRRRPPRPAPPGASSTGRPVWRTWRIKVEGRSRLAGGRADGERRRACFGETKRVLPEAGAGEGCNLKRENEKRDKGETSRADLPLWPSARGPEVLIRLAVCAERRPHGARRRRRRRRRPRASAPRTAPSVSCWNSSLNGSPVGGGSSLRSVPPLLPLTGFLGCRERKGWTQNWFKD